MDQLMLLKPEKEYSEQISAYRQAFLDHGDPMEGTGTLYRMAEPQDWLTFVQSLSHPSTVPENWDVTTQYICVRPYDNRLVGMILVRHTLNPYLALFGGHVEFSVLPEDRGKGYATWMLRSVLPYCREFGLDRVILSCDPGWAAGKRVIEKNGGVFLEKVYDTEYETDVERWAIDLKK